MSTTIKTRDECWMTFSEALEQYLSARDCLQRQTAGWKEAPERMQEAAEHMDVLTQPLSEEPGRA